ncbi:MAG TPA: hypothetical protein VFF67_08820 [Thermoplasmata archaeon]|nr:hypothetical protein [Thermoplasmata archaeon]
MSEPSWIGNDLLVTPRSVFISGDSRVGVNRVAWELAQRVNPSYFWLEVGTAEDSVDPDDPVVEGVVPPAQLYRTIPPSDLNPDVAVANLAMWSVIRSDEPAEVIHTLTDFLRLPPIVQEAIGSAPRNGMPGMCVFANGDRVAKQWPDDPSESRRLFEVWTRERVTLACTFVGPNRRDRLECDYVFKFRSGPGGSWRTGSMIYERAPEEVGVRVGESVPAFAPRDHPAPS